MTEAAFGVGAYSVPEAARLLGMTPVTLRRWLYGYEYEQGAGEQPPLWRAQYDADEGDQLLGFRDLIEARIVNALKLAKFGLPTIRKCIEIAREMVGSDHPFSTTAFKHDGKRLFLEMVDAAGETVMYDLKGKQRVFRDFVLPSLQGLEFGADAAERWWLVPGRRTLVADPERSFGQPIVAGAGVLTSRIAQDVRAEGSANKVAKLYYLPVRAVRDAVAFEANLQRRKAA